MKRSSRKQVQKSPVITPQFREVTRGSVNERHVFIDNRPDPQYRYHMEKNPRRAQELEAISNAWVQRRVPVQKVLLRKGPFVLLDYIAGETLEGKRLTGGQIAEMARMVAKMHSAHIPLKIQVPKIETVFNRIKERTRILEQERFLTASQANRLRTFFLTHAATRLPLVLSHNDLARDNIVTRKGKLVAIDIGDAGISFRDFELWRTMTKLKLTPQQQARFISEYKRNGGNTNEFTQTQQFWKPYALFLALYSHRNRRPKKEIKELTQEIFASLPKK